MHQILCLQTLSSWYDMQRSRKFMRNEATAKNDKSNKIPDKSPHAKTRARARYLSNPSFRPSILPRKTKAEAPPRTTIGTTHKQHTLWSVFSKQVLCSSYDACTNSSIWSRTSPKKVEFSDFFLRHEVDACGAACSDFTLCCGFGSSAWLMVTQNFQRFSQQNKSLSANNAIAPHKRYPHSLSYQNRAQQQQLQTVSLNPSVPKWKPHEASGATMTMRWERDWTSADATKEGTEDGAWEHSTTVEKVPRPWRRVGTFIGAFVAMLSWRLLDIGVHNFAISIFTVIIYSCILFFVACL